MASTSDTVLKKVNHYHYAIESYLDEEGMNHLLADFYKEVESRIELMKVTEEQNRDQCILNRETEKGCIAKIKNNVKFEPSFPYSFEIFVSSEKEVLIEKRTQEDGEDRIVLPWEDSFDIAWQAHTSLDHCNESRLNEYLSLKYVINKFVAEAICAVCYICKAANKTNVRCCASIISNPAIKPDFKFDSILVYEDLATNFVQLRPLNKEAYDLDIAMEIFKIITDFGPPANLEVNEAVFLPAMDYLKTLMPDVEIKVRLTQRDETRLNFITEKILEWITSNGGHWGIGCHVVQWELNNTKVQSDKK